MNKTRARRRIRLATETTTQQRGQRQVTSLKAGKTAHFHTSHSCRRRKRARAGERWRAAGAVVVEVIIRNDQIVETGRFIAFCIVRRRPCTFSLLTNRCADNATHTLPCKMSSSTMCLVKTEKECCHSCEIERQARRWMCLW